MHPKKRMSGLLCCAATLLFQSKSHTNTLKKIPPQCNSHNKQAIQNQQGIDHEGSEDPTSISHLHNLSNKDFRNKTLRMFKEFNDTMEQTDNKTQKDLKMEMLENFKQK